MRQYLVWALLVFYFHYINNELKNEKEMKKKKKKKLSKMSNMITNMKYIN